MQVYAVIGGIDFEGEDGATLKLFDCKSTAEAYSEKLKEDFDYTLVRIFDVIEGSALAA
jgi:hypothetical protein